MILPGADRKEIMIKFRKRLFFDQRIDQLYALTGF
jgi:hypothetical protein